MDHLVQQVAMLNGGKTAHFNGNGSNGEAMDVDGVDWGEAEKYLKQDQRRLRHLTSISIQNLTLNPKRDEISSFLSMPLPFTSTSASSSTIKPSPSSSSSGSTLSNRRRLQFASDDTDLYLRTRRRAGSNASLRAVSKAPTIEESAAENVTDDALPETSSFGSAPVLPAVMRRRSTSRVSIASIGSIASNGSGSTIRAPGIIAEVSNPDDEGRTASGVSQEEGAVAMMEQVANGRVSYASELLLVKEKRRRVEMLRRRLVDCFITLSIPPPASPEETENNEKRRRGMSTSGSSGSVRVKLARNDSSSSVKRGRRSTLSTSSVPAIDPSPPSPPFYVSHPTHAKIHPIFDIDRQDFLVDEPEEWPGLREERVAVGVWVASGDMEGERKAEDWTLLVEWDVDLSGLVSLGRDPHAFPPLPPNTLIFTLNSTYYTARSHSVVPKPSFHYASSSPDEGSDGEDGNLSDPGVRYSRKSKAQGRRVT